MSHAVITISILDIDHDLDFVLGRITAYGEFSTDESAKVAWKSRAVPSMDQVVALVVWIDEDGEERARLLADRGPVAEQVPGHLKAASKVLRNVLKKQQEGAGTVIDQLVTLD